MLLLTKPVNRLQHLSGYLRAGMSLADYDNYSNQLLTGLISGMILALLFSCVGVVWLVRQALKPLEHTLEKLSQFTSDASHELRSPLMAVKTNADVALRHPDRMSEGERKKFVAILDAANQMIRTTTDLLKLAHIEEDSRCEGVAKLNLSDLISQLACDIAPLASSKSIVVSTQHLSGDVFAMAREEDMKSLVTNVLENAIQYTNPFGKVSVKTYKDGKRVVIEIVDNGIGIRRDELPKIFDRFWRSDKARSHRIGVLGVFGWGVRAILDRYGGKVTVSSQLGEGTTVVLMLLSADC